jgi:multiple sugar transport system permease protein
VAEARRRRIESRWPAVWFIAPSVIALLTVGLFPLAYTIYNSFHYYKLTDPAGGRPFVGLENYAEVLTNPSFIDAVLRTLGFLLLVLPIELALGLFIANLLHKPGVSFLRSLTRLSLVIPMATTYAVVGLIGRLIFNREFGVVNHFLIQLGVGPVEWLGNATNAFLALAIMDVWQWTPFCALVLLAGFTTVPAEIEEAGRLETRSWWKMLLHIQLPFLLPAITAILILRTADILKKFDEIFTMTDGGPGAATELVSVYIQRIGFKIFDQGLASAQAVLVFILCIVLSRLYLALVYRNVTQ